MKGKGGPRPSDVQETNTPEQKSLNGMEDREIAELQQAALKYAAIRDQRQKLTAQEVELKGDMLKLMKKHKRDHYAYNGVEIDRVVEEETVKVRVRKQDEED